MDRHPFEGKWESMAQMNPVCGRTLQATQGRPCCNSERHRIEVVFVGGLRARERRTVNGITVHSD